MSADEVRAGASLAGVYGLRMLGLFFILPVFAVHAATLRGGADLTLVGIAIGGYGLAQGVLQIPYGMASDRWGRKPLILVKACVLGALLPATAEPEADVAIFEKLMAIDDEAFLRREFRPSCLDLVKRLHPMGRMTEGEAERLFVIRRRKLVAGRAVWEVEPFQIAGIDKLGRDCGALLAWSERVGAEERPSWELRWVQSFDYLARVAKAQRQEQLDQDALFEPIWDEVNGYRGTSAKSMVELVEQLAWIPTLGKRLNTTTV